MPRKGRNYAVVDDWLETLGLYRKSVAYDETCLFRSVSEQLFNSQIYHERVRTECITYAHENYEIFMQMSPSTVDRNDFHNHLCLLRKHMVICGNLEIQIVSRLYARDVIIYDAASLQVYNVTNRNMMKNLRFCLTKSDHYDAVYNMDHIITAGFCQSFVYEMLYEHVFNVKDASQIAKQMLNDKEPFLYTQTDNEINKIIENDDNYRFTDSNSDSEVNSKATQIAKYVTTSTTKSFVLAPFPFKVAKALDPDIYRNIEYDSWTEIRREMRLGEWYYGDDRLILGTRCILTDHENQDNLECYIQEIRKSENRCIVYITKLAERRTVNYSDLSAENDAKPWPLPYRFSKNPQTATTTNQRQQNTMNPSGSTTTTSSLSTATTSSTTVCQLKPLRRFSNRKSLVLTFGNGNSTDKHELFKDGGRHRDKKEACVNGSDISEFIGAPLQMKQRNPKPVVQQFIDSPTTCSIEAQSTTEQQQWNSNNLESGTADVSDGTESNGTADIAWAPTFCPTSSNAILWTQSPTQVPPPSGRGTVIATTLSACNTPGVAPYAVPDTPGYNPVFYHPHQYPSGGPYTVPPPVVATPPTVTWANISAAPLETADTSNHAIEHQHSVLQSPPPSQAAVTPQQCNLCQNQHHHTVVTTPVAVAPPPMEAYPASAPPQMFQFLPPPPPPSTTPILLTPYTPDFLHSPVAAATATTTPQPILSYARLPAPLPAPPLPRPMESAFYASVPTTYMVPTTSTATAWYQAPMTPLVPPPPEVLAPPISTTQGFIFPRQNSQ